VSWFTKIAEYEMYRQQVQRLSTQNPYPFKEWFDEEGRAYIPFFPGGAQGQEGVDVSVQKELEGNDWQIVDYRKGLAAKGNRQMRIGKILNSLRQQAITELQQQYQTLLQDPDPVKQQIFTNQLQTELESTNKYYDEVINTFVNSAYRAQQGAVEFYVVISQNPHDVAQMSTGRQWTSCMELGEGEHYDDVFCEVAGGGLIAYLIRANDREIEDPLARIHIRRFDNREGQAVAVPEQSIYGNEIQGFAETVQSWLNERQGIVAPGAYERQGGQYSDTFGKTFLAAPTTQEDVISWLRGQGKDAQYSTWTVEDLLYDEFKQNNINAEIWGGDYYDPPDPVEDDSKTFRTQEEAQAYYEKMTANDQQYGEYTREEYMELDPDSNWAARDEETGEWEEERYWLKENKTDNRSDMTNEAIKIILSAPKGEYPPEVIQEVKDVLFGGKIIHSPRKKEFMEAYPELFSDEEIKELTDTDSLALFKKLPPERQEQQRTQWASYVSDVLEKPEILINQNVQDRMKERDRATDVNDKVKAEESVGLHYSIAVNDWLLDPMREVFQPIPEPLIQSLVSFAQNFLQEDNPIAPYKGKHVSERYNNEILSRIIGTLDHTGSDTPTVQRFYEQVLPLWRDNRENYYDDYSQINVNTLGNAIGRLGENGRAFLPFIDQKIAEETEAIKQLEASIPEEEKSRRTNQDLLKRAYGKIQKLYYIKDSIESGTGRSNIYKYHVRKGNWFKQAGFKMRGYKAVGYNPQTGQGYSLYGGTGMPIDINIGSWMDNQTPAGFFLGSSKEYVLDYYSGLTDDPELMLTYEYDSDETVDRSVADHSVTPGEIRVRRAQLVAVEQIEKDDGGVTGGIVPFQG